MMPARARSFMDSSRCNGEKRVILNLRLYVNLHSLHLIPACDICENRRKDLYEDNCYLFGYWRTFTPSPNDVSISLHMLIVSSFACVLLTCGNSPVSSSISYVTRYVMQYPPLSVSCKSRTGSTAVRTCFVILAAIDAASLCLFTFF